MSFAPLQNDTFLRACLGQATEHTPVWLMRQAGRYLPEYVATRAAAGSFMGLATNVDYATEVTLQPLARYDSTPRSCSRTSSPCLTRWAWACTSPKARGRASSARSRTSGRSATSRARSPCRAAVRDGRGERDPPRLDGSVPLIGFSGSPWTLACYMVEGGSSSDYRKVKSLAYSRPDLMHHILEVTAQAVVKYLNAQIEAGAQAVMVFDSWGGVLSEAAYKEFSLRYLEQVVAGLIRERDGQRVPSIVFTKGGGLWLESIAAIGCDAVGLDWTMDIGRARSAGGRQGRAAGQPRPQRAVRPARGGRQRDAPVLTRYGNHPGHVFNLGHGISQFTPPENVNVLVDTVHSYSREIRARG
jgi:uroporphyrinogen decarboxylase (EC 4.1.1.37)